MTRERWLQREGYGIAQLRIAEAEAVRRNVDWLIGNLYRPDAEVGARASGVPDDWPDEAINWGDLHCLDVVLDADGLWHVLVEEADPSAVTLCAYLREWLGHWGWRAEVKTEW